LALLPAWITFLILYGLFFGLCGFLVVHSVVRAVDWLDNLMKTTTPPEG
jgi:hypothetical protein